MHSHVFGTLFTFFCLIYIFIFILCYSIHLFLISFLKHDKLKRRETVFRFICTFKTWSEMTIKVSTVLYL